MQKKNKTKNFAPNQGQFSSGNNKRLTSTLVSLNLCSRFDDFYSCIAKNSYEALYQIQSIEKVVDFGFNQNTVAMGAKTRKVWRG